MTVSERSVSGWRPTIHNALYGPAGFFRADGPGPAAHFRTSAHASGQFAAALVRLITHVDAALGHPDPFTVVDIGAGRGELLTRLRAQLAPDPARLGGPAEPIDPVAAWRAMVQGQPARGGATPAKRLAERVEWVGVEIAGRPDGLHGAIRWRADVPERVVGLVLGTEWLDNVAMDVAEVDADGRIRKVLVDPDTGAETLGDVVDAAEAFWLSRWWPLTAPGERAEIGWPRDRAWADAVGAVERGCALAVDYGHVRAGRPPLGTLTGYRHGRQVPPIPDGSCDITAHVAMDAAAVAAGAAYTLVGQREALRALGVDGARPPLSLASTDPAGYLRALSDASSAAELTDPAGLGGHWWLLHGIGMDVPSPLRPTAGRAHTMLT